MLLHIFYGVLNLLMKLEDQEFRHSVNNSGYTPYFDRMPFNRMPKLPQHVDPLG